MRRAVLALGMVVLAGCTPDQIDAWVIWWERDPDAAVAFAERPEIQADLAAAAEPARSVWDDLAWCESGERWAYNGGSGYDGGLQFWPPTWEAYGGNEFTDRAWQASRAQQIIVAERVLADVGWQAWPACSRKLGLR